MDEKKRAPKLRFKGFTDDWEQRKFGDLVFKLSKTSNIRSLPNITYDDIVSKENSLNKNITELTHGKKGIYFSKDDILFGKLRPYLENILLAKFNGIAVGDFWVFSPKDNNISSFLFDLIQTSRYKYISNLSSGSKMPRSDWNLVSKASFWIPAHREQNKIGKIFQLIDNLISLQQRKLEHLKLLKKAMLQQLFTNDKTPILRFKEFNSAWEQRKLGDLANILRGASPRPIKDKKWFDPNSKIGWIRISDVTAQNGKVYVLNQHLSKEGQKKTRVVHPQTLLLSIAASVGYPVITYIETGVHDGFVIFDHPQFNLDFMFFKLQEIQKFWNKYGQSGSQININSSIVANTKILIPTNKEQRYISIILTKVEKSITLQLQNINRFEQMKKFLLQNMFI